MIVGCANILTVESITRIQNQDTTGERKHTKCNNTMSENLINQMVELGNKLNNHQIEISILPDRFFRSNTMGPQYNTTFF